MRESITVVGFKISPLFARFRLSAVFDLRQKWGGKKESFLLESFFFWFQLVNQSACSVAGCSTGSSFLGASDLQVHSHSLNPKLNLLSSPSGDFFGGGVCSVYVDAGEFLNADQSKDLTSGFYSVTEDPRFSLLFHPS